MYPAWLSDTYPSPQGYARGFNLTDPIGLAFIEAGLKLGVPIAGRPRMVADDAGPSVKGAIGLFTLF